MRKHNIGFSEQSAASVVKVIEEYNLQYDSLGVFLRQRSFQLDSRQVCFVWKAKFCTSLEKAGAMTKGINAFSSHWSDNGSMHTLLFGIRKNCRQIYPTGSIILTKPRCFQRRVRKSIAE